MTIILLLILTILLLGGLPHWPHQAFGWGYYPSGIAGVLLIVLLILLLIGRL